MGSHLAVRLSFRQTENTHQMDWLDFGYVNERSESEWWWWWWCASQMYGSCVEMSACHIHSHTTQFIRFCFVWIENGYFFYLSIFGWYCSHIRSIFTFQMRRRRRRRHQHRDRIYPAAIEYTRCDAMVVNLNILKMKVIKRHLTYFRFN